MSLEELLEARSCALDRLDTVLVSIQNVEKEREELLAAEAAVPAAQMASSSPSERVDPTKQPAKLQRTLVGFFKVLDGNTMKDLPGART